ncbi:MAG: copper resistance system multicopper oxidase [Pseudomonadota bacterium]|nr:copper resistance system multicopper oxidase [Pseudomonadota bacterium]
MKFRHAKLTRRRFVAGLASGGVIAAYGSLLPAYARTATWGTAATVARRAGEVIDLHVHRMPWPIGARMGEAVGINGTVPGPLLRLREGEDLTIRVHNQLTKDTSIHWHGLLLPFDMDGVPGVSFPGIAPSTTFTYRFPVRQSGTYWYHSHSGMQEQLGHYGPIIIDPAERDPVAYDREHVILLSDWTFENPHHILAKLKKHSDFDNFQKRTVQDLLRDVEDHGWAATLRDRWDWAAMRMSATDIADVTGHTYTYLLNGQAPESNWTGLFRPGERVRLRLINAATMTYFNFRIPGLPLTVVQADGQDVEPVETDELQIGVAETYDVIVRPTHEQAYTVFAESLDRSGFARGTLSPRSGLSAPVPPLRERPLRSMVDMGMAMHHMPAGKNTPPGETDQRGHDGHAGHTGHAMSPAVHPIEHQSQRQPGAVVARHLPDGHGPGNVSVAEVQRDRLAEPGTGLADVPHRVLVYSQLRRLDTDFDSRPPTRELELHLTGHMERYLWSFDGTKFSDAASPVEFVYGERLRLVLVNDTMMEHPIHLHGMWMELENGQGSKIPRKHTISVKPAERLSVLINADAPGRWAFHCHFLYHMELGMFRVVRVS